MTLIPSKIPTLDPKAEPLFQNIPIKKLGASWAIVINEMSPIENRETRGLNIE